MSVRKTTVLLFISSLVCLSAILMPVSAVPVDLTTMGSLSIVSDPPGSDVYLDGFYQGLTPVTINYLAPGSHDIQLDHAGYYDWKSTTVVVPGKTTTVSGTLIPVPSTDVGSIYISSTPGGASVTVDGYAAGETSSGDSLKLGNVPAGNHEITLVLTGYQTQKITTAVAAHAISQLSITLLPVTPAPGDGVLLVSSAPVEANVFLDNVFAGVTPLSLVTVPDGEHLVSIRAAGYQEYLQPVLVKTGASTTVNAVLSPETPATTQSPFPVIAVLAALAVCAMLVVRRLP
jgi:hypothetical protein